MWFARHGCTQSNMRASWRFWDIMTCWFAEMKVSECMGEWHGTVQVVVCSSTQVTLGFIIQMCKAYERSTEGHPNKHSLLCIQVRSHRHTHTYPMGELSEEASKEVRMHNTQHLRMWVKVPQVARLKRKNGGLSWGFHICNEGFLRSKYGSSR